MKLKIISLFINSSSSFYVKKLEIPYTCIFCGDKKITVPWLKLRLESLNYKFRKQFYHLILTAVNKQLEIFLNIKFEVLVNKR